MDLTFLSLEWLGKPVWMWAAFMSVVATLLVLDLGVLNRKDSEVGFSKSLILSAGYIAMGLAFGAAIWWQLGADAGMSYVTGFIVEKTLALDNVFLIALIFSYFAIPAKYQHRVLFWGILGAIVLRGLMIALGATLVSEFSWVLDVFAAFLILTGIKMLFSGDAPPDVENNPLTRFLRRRLNVTDGLRDNRFLVREPDPATGRLRLHATRLFLALILVEIADIIFAVDSVPAIFAITSDPYIVYTSNIFAILGLRALYFALAAMVDRFKYLKPALAFVLIFIGSKVFVADFLGLVKFPPVLSLGITFAILGTGVIVSLIATRRKAEPLPDRAEA
ncbi:TerC family protein [Oryzibacter oryziterrae]|uniref:TerC family protein n=1 Tax=Oryzibacter oryziterrae TaxID=2766474 RepID=UPI001F344151|nr:TerC family protein [Oryzibacter oryziterrae]